MNAEFERGHAALADKPQAALAIFTAPHRTPTAASCRKTAEALAVRLSKDFKFSCDGYDICLTNGIDSLKRKTARLIERMYTKRGLFPYGGGENLDDRDITVAACKDGNVAATLTLCLDVGAGLLADTLYRDSIDQARKKGGRVCEITRLAMDPDQGSREALAGMLQLLYVVARLIYGVTDIFIEVHPRHAGFYRRLLGYRIAGPKRTCPRVNAPAVLMHLCQTQLESLIEQHAGGGDEASRSFYRLFQSRNDLERVRQELIYASLPQTQNQRLSSR